MGSGVRQASNMLIIVRRQGLPGLKTFRGEAA